ncbi:hypothetical protein MPLA_30032 [Mesorhizobium sp. ORS 3359]|nr:hypothetical protein MPLA_30032 [Mesorhizobium sp. ORS 3359]
MAARHSSNRWSRAFCQRSVCATSCRLHLAFELAALIRSRSSRSISQRSCRASSSRSPRIQPGPRMVPPSKPARCWNRKANETGLADFAFYISLILNSDIHRMLAGYVKSVGPKHRLTAQIRHLKRARLRTWRNW